MIDLEELRREIADLLERHFRPMFRREVRLNFVAIHPSNPDAHLFVGPPSGAGPVDWVICGSESGPERRPTDPAWVRALRDHCQSARVPFFLKQLEQDGRLEKLPEIDGQSWAQLPRKTP